MRFFSKWFSDMEKCSWYGNDGQTYRTNSVVTHKEFGSKRKKFNIKLITSLSLYSDVMGGFYFLIFSVLCSQEAFLYNYINIFLKAFNLEFIWESKFIMLIGCLFLLWPNQSQQSLEPPWTQIFFLCRERIPDFIT